MVNLPDAMSRITICPVCHAEISDYEEGRMRACPKGCCEFVIRGVSTDGAVEFRMIMEPWQTEDIEVVPVAPHVE